MGKEDEKQEGRIVQTFNIGTVGQLNPMATTVVNNYYGEHQKDKDGNGTPEDKETLRNMILDYVGRTLYLVSDEWRNKYMSLWEDILKTAEVDATVYDRGKQVGTRFNRALVANIMHFLGNYKGKKQGVYKEWEAKKLAMQLEGTWECSTRNHLGIDPSTAIQKAILKLINSPEYKS